MGMCRPVKVPLIACMNVVDSCLTVIYAVGCIVSISRLYNNNVLPLFLLQTWMSVLGRMEVASMSV